MSMKSLLAKHGHEIPAFIGIGGKLRAGKDCVADYLVEHHGFVKIGMADALHEQMLKLNPIVDWTEDFDQITYAGATRDFGYTDAKANFPEYRRLLQSFGDVLKDLHGPDALVDLAWRRAKALLRDGKSVVLTGVRFPNEVRMIGELRGTSWWVERPSLAAEQTNAHASENSVRAVDFDDVLVNSGTLERLYAATEIALKGVRA